MNMLQELDYTTLKWVKDEIGESLKQTRQALEAYVENPDNKTQIRFCATYLHQIYGTLQMVEIYGGALLAEEMEMLTDAILGDRVTQKDDAYDVLMRAIIQLPSYLEHIEQGHNDQPVILLPLLNDLRAARGDTLLSDNAFFSPNLSILPPSITNKKEPKEPDIQKYIKKLRTAYQAALVRVYRNENPKANLKKIASVLRELHNLSTNANASRLWWVASAVIEAIYEGGIEAHNSVKLLIGHIDREIKRIVETGKRALQEDPPADLVKNLLYYVALAKSSGHRVVQIKQAFSLEAVLPGAGEIDAAFDSLKGSSNELLKSVSTVIKEDLLQIKDQLDIFVRSSEQKPSQLEPLTEQLVRISDTLAMLGFGDLRKIIQDQVNNVKQLAASGDTPSEMSLMEIASALLFVESSLDGIESRELVSQGTEDTAGAETLLPAGEQKHLTKLVISEAAEVLARVKETLNTFANDTSKLDLLVEIPEYLGQVKGVLAVLAFDQASHLLQSAIEYIRDEVLDKRKNPNQAALDAIADVITSIEYYLEAVTESRRNPESILTVAIDSVSKLGYPVEATDQTTQPVEEKKLAPAPISVESLETTSQGMASEPGKGKEAEKAQVDAVQPVDEPPPAKDVSSHQAQITQMSPPSSTPVGLEDDIDEEILEIFIEEADEVLVTMKDNLRGWQANNENKDALDVLRRSYHTIKGSGRLAGAATIGEFAWVIEDMLNQIIDGKVEPNAVIFGLLSKAETVLESLINQLKGQEGSIASADIQTLSELADSVTRGETPSALPPSFLDARPESGEASETSDAQEPEIELPSDEASAKQSQEMTLTDIFRKETAVHLQSIRDFINGYNDSVPQFVSNPLRLALHTLHGSARMANVSEIAHISELLDRYFRTLYDTHQAISADALSILSDGAALISEMHQHFTETDRQIPDTSDFQKRISILHQLADRTSLEEMESADSELVAIFVDEGTDILENISSTLASRDEQNDIDIMESLQRLLHTLKGGARMAGIKPIAELAYRLESMFAAIAERKETLNYDLIVIANDCHAWLEKALNQIRENADPDSSEPLLNRINRLIGLESEPIESKAETIDAGADAVGRLEPAPESEDVIELELGDFSLELEPDKNEYQEHDNELLSIFLDEATEIQSVLGDELEEWRKNIEGLNPIGGLQRSLHTLKGGARMASVTAISDIAHALETLLEDIVEKRAIVSDQHIRLVQAGHDWFAAALDQARNNEPLETTSALLAEIQAQSALAKAAKRQMTVEIDMMQTSAPESAAEETLASPSNTNEDGENPTIEINMSQVVVDATVDIPDFATANIQTGTTESEPSDYDSELLGVFLEEAEEIQETCDRIIHQWIGDYAHREYISELQRALHTLKGGARMANIKAIGNLSHAIESLLEAVTEDKLQPTAAFPLAVQAGHDWITHSIQKLKNNEEIEEATGLLTQLEQLASGETVSFQEKLSEEPPEPVELIDLPTNDTLESQKPVRRIHHTAVRSRDEQVRIGADLIDTLVNNAGEINIYNARINQQFNDWHFNLAELNQTTQRLHEQLRKFEIETEAQIMYRHSSSGNDGNDADATEGFDPLELDRFSYMQQLSRSLVESLGDLTSIQSMLESNSTDADVLLLQQSRINSDLQEGLMRTRLTPFSSVLARLRRIVRQTCKETGKEANLNVEGAEGEMDRTQLNRIVPALEHVVRNAIDHGIEPPVKREKSGKNREGNINIRFSREGSEVVLQVSDDGAGIDLKALREKAIERGLIGKQSTISDSDLTEFILESGFSTATEVTQISGRGIGMDVVNNEIKQLNGSLVIHTEEGKGSAFTIRLPLTVLINNALLLHVDEAIYAVQISNIEHVIRVTGDELGKLISGEEEFYHYASHQYQHIHLGHVLHGTRPKVVSGKEHHPLLLGRSGDHRVAMQVDQLIGRQEIVVKSVGPQLSTVNNISGATILPDGEVALILDVGTLIRTNLALQQKLEETGEALYVERAAIEDKARPTSVMIVDDSITVRKVTERLLKRYNMDTCTAKDGVDALTQLLETIPDIMLLDIEMPRMDGYELAQAMKNDPRLKDIPIIMITSRSGEKHRERALSIGVNMYMGKPYQEHDLLNNIQSLLAKGL